MLKPSRYTEAIWTAEFPAAEQARYHAGRQSRLLELIPAWMQRLHIALASVSILAVLVLAWRAVRRREPIGGLYLVIPVMLVANAVVAGALSGVFDRYQSRFVWLAPLAVLLTLCDQFRTPKPRAARPFRRDRPA